MGELMKLRLVWLIYGAWLAVVTGSALATQIEHATRRTSGDIEFQYGLMPAKVVARHAKDHVERKMHGGSESSSSTHVVVALFDRKSGARISDAEVEATVTLLGSASVRKRLEPMTVADQPSYGAFFSMGVPGPLPDSLRSAKGRCARRRLRRVRAPGRPRRIGAMNDAKVLHQSPSGGHEAARLGAIARIAARKGVAHYAQRLGLPAATDGDQATGKAGDARALRERWSNSVLPSSNSGRCSRSGLTSERHLLYCQQPARVCIDRRFRRDRVSTDAVVARRSALGRSSPIGLDRICDRRRTWNRLGDRCASFWKTLTLRWRTHMRLKRLMPFFLTGIVMAGSAFAQYESRTSTSQGVTVKVSPKVLVADAPVWEFAVVLDTHSAELSDDLAKTAALIGPDGKRIAPLAWEGSLAGGHHRQGVIRFQSITPVPRAVELQMQRPGEDKPRVFRWDCK